MLTDPIELLEIPDGQTVELHIERGWFDQALIHPDRKPEGDIVPALRLFVVEGSKERFPFYWDITSKRLMAMLATHLGRADLKERTFAITAHGVAPNKYFSVEVR